VQHAIATKVGALIEGNSIIFAVQKLSVPINTLTSMSAKNVTGNDIAQHFCSFCL